MRGTSAGTMIRTLLLIWATFAIRLPQTETLNQKEEIPNQQQHAFGDMIVVAKRHISGRPLYTHWAIYVGLGNVQGLEGKNDNKDIFHINSVRPPRFSDCVYGIRGTTIYETSNYLDEDGHGIRNADEMKQTINNFHHNCGRWWPLTHNCEHIATFIRYGFQHSEQRNTWFGQWFRGMLRRHPDIPAPPPA